MTVEYRDETPFTNDLHTLQQIADALRHKKFGKDVREAIAQAVEKLYGIGPNTVISGSPAGAYATLSDLQSAYPNGQQGVFVVAETGKWYIWNPRENRWDEGGNFQSPMSQNEISDGRIWTDGTVSPKIGDAIRGQVAQEKVGRVQADLQEKTERQDVDRALNERIDLRDTALEVKNVRLKDNDGNFLWNGDDYVTGGVYLPKTDKTGLEGGLPVDSSIIGYTFLGHLKEYGLPILKLENPEIPGLQKSDGKLEGVKFDYDPNGYEGQYTHKTGQLKHLKVQGASSARWPKKNYTLKFNNDIQFNTSWGWQDKYVIKADWTDFSHMRNEFGAWLWGQIRKTRINPERNQLVDNDGNYFVRTEVTTLAGETEPQFAMGMNLGAIDSYPVLVIINDVYHGLYSFTVPKDGWMAGMGYGDEETIVSAETHTRATQFWDHVMIDDGKLTGEDFSLEYTNEEDETLIPQSLDALIDSVKQNSDVENHLDIESAIDYLIMNLVIGGLDGVDKNYLLDTWDGVKWSIMAYDMDSTFGNSWNGVTYVSYKEYDLDFHVKTNNLFKWLVNHHKDDFVDRWTALRTSMLDDLDTMLYDFANKIPQSILTYEANRWPEIPGTRTNNVAQITHWLSRRIKFLDEQMALL